MQSIEEFNPQQVMRRDVFAIQRKLRADKGEAAQAQLDQSIARLAARQATFDQTLEQIEYPAELPIADQAPAILAAIQSNQVVVVAGETGSGKTTQLPKIALQAGLGVRGLIGHTQPRRLAARTVASRIAEELNSPLGGAVGYSVRFSEQVQPTSLVKVMTDGLLLAEIPSDRWLNQYDALIIDEAHERSLNIDFLLGYLKALLQRRADLKVIITSATIDVAAFSKHFADAPIVEVSGRGYPVDIVYRDPAESDASNAEVIRDCLDEIYRGTLSVGPSVRTGRDVLVFLPGEREIADVSNLLRRSLGTTWEVVALYARLPLAEQQRVFGSSSTRRVILATNVAETSLTVPNIGFVLDTGTARISRYSYRSKLQRLPIEAVSQASAAQRSGRCGRIGPGLCVRLYGAEDFAGRPPFTDPEIQRTNLASVVLQMQAFGLGDIENFGFLDPPEIGAIRAAKRLLTELGAFVDDKITSLGTSMARLPIDPRLARILLEAHKQGALRDMLVIVSGLAVIDPRERPRDKQAAADAAHAEFAHPKSEFLSWLKLWDFVNKERESLTRRRFERLMHKHFISPNRLREWRALHRQLVLALKTQGMKPRDNPADYAAVHQSLLAGSLSFVGLHEEQGRYLGARNLKFRPFPGSSLSGTRARWIMAGEIVETSAVYARQLAVIEPGWVEEQAQHLVNRSYSEPHWSLKRGETLAYEKVSLYGLPLRDRHRVSYSKQDPALSRELFLRDGLAHGQLNAQTRRQFGFLSHNETLKQTLLDIEARTRRRDLVISDEEEMLLYESRVPAQICHAQGLLRWLRRDPNNDAKLRFTRQDLERNQSPEVADFPSELQTDDYRYELKYSFAPGEPDDGVSLLVPLGRLNTLVPELLHWSVPGLLPGVIEQRLKALPKLTRKQLAPVPDKIPDLMERLLRPSVYRRGRLVNALIGVVHDLFDVRISVKDCADERVPDYLQMNVKVLGEGDAIVAQGRNLLALQAKFSGQLAAEVAAGGADAFEQPGLTAFPAGVEVSAQRNLSAVGSVGELVGFPALVDQQQAVDLKLFTQAKEAATANRTGYARLALLHLRSDVRAFRAEIKSRAKLGLHYATIGTLEQLVDDLLLGVSWYTFFEGQSRPEDEASFVSRLNGERGRMAVVFREVLDSVCDIFAARFELTQLLDALTSPAFAFAVADARQQVAILVPANLLQTTNSTQLQHLPRYLQALRLRLDNLQGKVAKDEQQALMVQALEARLAIIRDLPTADETRVEALGMLLNELRVALFAERLKQGKVSPKRAERAMADYELELGLI